MSQLTPDQLQALLNYASQRLGISPEQLKETVQSGNLSSLTDKAGGNDLSALIKDPQKAEQLLRSPQAQALLNQLMGGK